jgi:predicted acetyltransferase
MSVSELELRSLCLEDEQTFFEAAAEFEKEGSHFEFALDHERGEPFGQYLDRLAAWSRGEGLPEGFVPAGFYVGVVRGAVVGRVSIRFRMNEFLSRIGGHIGYGVRPSRRRQGYATRMLQLALPICRDRQIERALVTCDIDNLGSRRVIERCGGVLESITADPSLAVQKRRYWVPV